MLGYEMTSQECSMGYSMLDYVPPCPTEWEKSPYHMHANRSPLEVRSSNVIYSEGVLSSEFNTHSSLLILNDGAILLRNIHASSISITQCVVTKRHKMTA